MAPRTPAGEPALPRGVDLLRDPALNKGTAFTEAERDAFGLRGLLPPLVATQDEQVGRMLENLRRVSDPLDKYIRLESLHTRNEALFYRLLLEHPDEMLPIIYTPTVGLACQRFGHIYTRPRGLYITARDRGRVAAVLRNWPYREVDIIVVTDGERILGLGDLGANGMGIPVGKLALYSACAGVHPSRTLPVTLDVGTNNAALLEDPLYLGLKQRRVTGPDYDALVEEFIAATQAVFPGVVVQFEDFAKHNAFRMLRKYRERICTFNDDIQGTASVVLAGVLSALRVSGGHMRDQKILFMGAGGAATGISDLLCTAIQADGRSEQAARERLWLFDSHTTEGTTYTYLDEPLRSQFLNVFADGATSLRGDWVPNHEIPAQERGYWISDRVDGFAYISDNGNINNDFYAAPFLVRNAPPGDTDWDGVPDSEDAYPSISLEGRLDTDHDGIPNDCDAVCINLGMLADDDDGDGHIDIADNCPLVVNADQADSNNDGLGDACDSDYDSVRNDIDNCPLLVNPDQADSNDDGVGNACDRDSDGVPNDIDNCVRFANPDQLDANENGRGDVCDNTPLGC